MNRKFLPLMAVVVGAALASSALADPRPLCADRPGKATPPCILDTGRVQLEIAPLDASLTRGGGERDDVYDVGHFELRTGLTPTAEASLAWTPLIEEHTRSGGHASGAGDLTLSLRQSLTDPDGDGFAAAIEPYVSAPTATHHMGPGGWQGGLILGLAKPLGGDFAVSATPELDVVRDSSGSGVHVAYTGVVGLSRAFGETSLGVELWASADQDPAGHATAASFDVTAAWAPKADPDLQLDAGVNAGLNHNTPDMEAYVGVTRRF